MAIVDGKRAMDEVPVLPNPGTSQTERGLSWRWRRSSARDNRALFGHDPGGEGPVWTVRHGLEFDEHALINLCLAEDLLDRQRPSLEAGTGGGRIVRALRELGFVDLAAFDFVPESIAQARANDPSGQIRFEVADATDLPYPDASFGQAVYLQQFLSLLETAAGREAAIREVHRILASGGVAIFSVLCFDGRGSTGSRAAAARAYAHYLGLRRRLRRSPLPLQPPPHLNVNGVLGLLLDWGPYGYWYRAAEIEGLLREVGFAVERVGTRHHVLAGHLAPGVTTMTEDLDKILYLVCRKPAAR